MTYIKYDSDLSASVKNDLTTIKNSLDGCFDEISIAANNAKISLEDPRVVVMEKVVKKPNFFAGIFGAKDEIVYEEKANYSANASLYNDAASSIEQKALEIKKEISSEIDKVLLAMEGIDKKIVEFETSPLVELDSFNIEYNDSVYGFLYGYASVGNVSDENSDDSITSPEIPRDNSDNQSNNEDDSKKQNSFFHNDSDGMKNEDDSNSNEYSSSYSGSDRNKNSNTNDEDNSSNKHNGNDGTYFGEDDDSSEDKLNNNDSDGNSDDKNSDSIVGGFSNNGSNGNDGSDDQSLIDALFVYSGSNGNNSNGDDNLFGTNNYSGNNGNKNEFNSDGNSSFGKDYKDGQYEGVPSTGLFGSVILGGTVASSMDDKDNLNKYGEKNRKYTLLQKAFQILMPIFNVLLLLGVIFDVISPEVFAVMFSIFTILGYFYLEKIFDVWTGGFKDHIGSIGKKSNSNESVKKDNTKYGIDSYIGYILVSIITVLDFFLVLLEIVSSYWFIWLLILLLIIIWLIVTDEDNDIKNNYRTSIVILIFSVVLLVLSIVLIIKEIVKVYSIVIVLIIVLLSIWYFYHMFKLNEIRKKEIL